ncbi:MAG: sulfotransferase family protein [Rhodobacterales bacterium]|nr:sulfotransferase family protein [Rhodobacterales bacterium]NCT12548.1 sulfotransferase family protein [Rhodobacterales bacterium]
MIISHARRYVFVHIPKTGGTAMTLALEARAARDDIILGDTPKAQARRARQAGLRAAGRLWKHSTLADLDGLLRPEDLAAMFTFTLVRNPWDRMVSYYHWLRAQRFTHTAVTRAQTLDFAAFLADPATQVSIATNPYTSYMRDSTGRERASAYLRLEHLATDLAPLAAHLGFLPRMGRANVTARPRDWRGFYTDATAEIVARIAAGDIARFGYRFDPAA